MFERLVSRIVEKLREEEKKENNERLLNKQQTAGAGEAAGPEGNTVDAVDAGKTASPLSKCTIL